ncbi:MAG: MFS transporter [Oscillospiraceae bacterium]|jgi:fucose permease|nr:MFS transporter [Oscillospiraceae bacterium]
MTVKHTRVACYISFIVQAIVNNLAPLLFVTFQRAYAITLEQIGAIIALNFITQMVVDALAAKFARRVSTRVLTVGSQACSSLGLIGLSVFPRIFPTPYSGLCAAMTMSAVGGGLIEVLISPIIESLPSENKAGSMSFLHSFYCWGQAGVALFSTIFFRAFGRDAWIALPFLWAIVPMISGSLFIKAPLFALPGDAHPISIRKLITNRLFIQLFIMMIASGASEIAMSQWSSLFAETGLGVSKTVGDLLGPCAFALAMGVARAYFGVRGSNIKLPTALALSAMLAVVCYLAASLSRNPLAALLGCAGCGMAVGLMWPGMLSLSASKIPEGGTALFAILALGGDTGCTLGPLLVGRVAGAVGRGALPRIAGWFGDMSADQAGLKIGLLAAVLFPIALAIFAWRMRNTYNQTSN